MKPLNLAARTAFAVAVTTFVASCATTSTVEPIKVPTPLPVVSAPPPPAAERATAEVQASFLESVQLSLTEPHDPIPVVEVVRALRRQGLNLVANLPLDGYTYGGLGFDNLDGRSALAAVFGPLGLDFKVDERAKLVELLPVRPRTIRLQIGDRKASFETSGESAKPSSGGQGGQGGGGGGGGGSGGGGGGGGQGGQSGGIAGVSASANETSMSKSSVSEDFWQQLSDELDRRLKVLVPKRAPVAASTIGIQNFAVPPPGDDSMPLPPASAPAQTGPIGFEEVTVGRYAINRATGAVTVQAPSYLMTDIDAYLSSVNDELQTMIVVEGVVLLVSNDESSQSGFDIAAFARFAKEYGLVVTNSALGGGLVVTRPIGGAVASITAPGAVAQSGLGVISDDGLLSVFLGFLEAKTSFKAIQKPYLSTASGVPAVFSAFEKQYLNQVSQQAAASNTNTAVASTNRLIPFQFGTSIRIRPNYDKAANAIRAQVALTQVVQSGTQAIDQVINDGSGSRTLRSQVPLDRTIDIQGEVYAPNNSLVILGGQIVEQATDNDSGITGLKKILPGIFSSSSKKSSRSTYYFALTLKTATEGRGGSELLNAAR